MARRAAAPAKRSLHTLAVALIALIALAGTTTAAAARLRVDPRPKGAGLSRKSSMKMARASASDDGPPDFTAKAVVGKEIKTLSLSKDLLAKDGWAVLPFYPLDFTFVCPTEIRELDGLADDFAKLKTSVAAISVDSVFSHGAWNAAPRESGGLGGVQIPLVADVTKQIARDYGVLVEDPEDELAGVALRAAFVIDSKRRVRAVQVNDENAGRSMEELKRLVAAFQHADAHGEGCPASWVPGRDTVVPNPEGSKEFFKKVGQGGVRGPSGWLRMRLRMACPSFGWQI